MIGVYRGTGSADPEPVPSPRHVVRSNLGPMVPLAFVVTLRSDQAIGAYRLTDPIEVVVDELDALGFEPSVGTAGFGREVTLSVYLDVNTIDPLDGVHQGPTWWCRPVMPRASAPGGVIAASAASVTTRALLDA